MTPPLRPVPCLVAASLVLSGLWSPARAEVPALRCGTATRTFTSEPADQVVPETTGRDFAITVGGMGPIADIDVFVDIESSRPGDLEITLLPPVNTIGGSGVVLTRGNGGTVVDAFRELTWDDQATAAGGDAITDLDFATFTGDRLPPQAPLSRLIGLGANGTWTLRVRDLSANGTTTRLRSWRLVVTSASRSPRDPETTRTHTFTSGTTSVPALGTAFLDITVPLTPLLERIVDVRVTTSLFHPDAGQYDVVLRRLTAGEAGDAQHRQRQRGEQWPGRHQVDRRRHAGDAHDAHLSDGRTRPRAGGATGQPDGRRSARHLASGGHRRHRRHRGQPLRVVARGS